MSEDNYLWIENEKGGKAVWANRRLYIAIDDAMLFLDVAHEGDVEIICSGEDIYYPVYYLKTRKQSEEWTATFNKWLSELYRCVAESLDDELMEALHDPA